MLVLQEQQRVMHEQIQQQLVSQHAAQARDNQLVSQHAQARALEQERRFLLQQQQQQQQQQQPVLLQEQQSLLQQPRAGAPGWGGFANVAAIAVPNAAAATAAAFPDAQLEPLPLAHLSQGSAASAGSLGGDGGGGGPFSGMSELDCQLFESMGDAEAMDSYLLMGTVVPPDAGGGKTGAAAHEVVLIKPGPPGGYAPGGDDSGGGGSSGGEGDDDDGKYPLARPFIPESVETRGASRRSRTRRALFAAIAAAAAAACIFVGVFRQPGARKPALPPAKPPACSAVGEDCFGVFVDACAPAPPFFHTCHPSSNTTTLDADALLYKACVCMYWVQVDNLDVFKPFHGCWNWLNDDIEQYTNKCWRTKVPMPPYIKQIGAPPKN